MPEKKIISLKDRLLAAAVIFGGECDVAEIDFRLTAYRALLDLARSSDNGTVDEFDIISTLEDLPSFKSREKLRKLANDLKLFERGSDGTMRIKEVLHLDDYRPGSFPFAAPASVPIGFVEEPEAEAGGFDEFYKAEIPGVLLQTMHGLNTFFKSAIGFQNKTLLSPFYRVLPSSNNKLPPFEEVGAPASTTALLDIVLFLNDVKRLPNIESDLDTTKIWANVESWAERQAACRLPPNDPYGDGGALYINDDDDYPGADRPSVLSNAQMLSATFVLDSMFSGAGYANIRTPLLEFVLSCQNDDGGWGPYRYRSELYRDKPMVASSIPLFSFLAFASLADFFFDGDSDRTLSERIVDAVDRYACLLVQSAQDNDTTAGWSNTFSLNDPIDLFDSAVNLHACVLLLKVFKLCDRKTLVRADILRELAEKCVRHICVNWEVGSTAQSNIHRIKFRVPTTQGSAGTEMVWEQPGDARLLRALSEASLAGISPGIDGYVKMAQAATEIVKACRQGFWMDLDASNARAGILNINSTITSASGLLMFERARHSLVTSTDHVA